MTFLDTSPFQPATSAMGNVISTFWLKDSTVIHYKCPISTDLDDSHLLMTDTYVMYSTLCAYTDIVTLSDTE